MKNSKFFKYAAIIGVLIAFNSCSNDTGLEIIEESSQLEFNQDLQSKNAAPCDLELLVTYTFSPFSTEEEQDDFKAQYRAYLAQYFTICEVVLANRSCPNSEKWTVNEDGYNNYELNPPTTPGGTSNTSNGSATITIVRRGGGTTGGGVDCFTNNFPF